MDLLSRNCWRDQGPTSSQLGLNLPSGPALGFKNFWPGCNLGNLLLVIYHRNLGMRGLDLLGLDLAGLDLLSLDLVGLNLGREGS